MPRFRRPRDPLLLVRQVAAALLVALALVLALRPAPEAPDDGTTDAAPVAVAAADLPAGTVLTRAQIALARLPADLVPGGIASDPGPLVGRVLAGSVRAREPLTDVRLVGAGLTALLPPGQVVAPVRPSDLAVAAAVRTGDRVDVLATPPDGQTAEVVAAGALVLAAPRTTSADDDASAGLLLVAVDPPTAERLAAASANSTLTVSLTPP